MVKRFYLESQLNVNKARDEFRQLDDGEKEKLFVYPLLNYLRKYLSENLDKLKLDSEFNDEIFSIADDPIKFSAINLLCTYVINYINVSKRTTDEYGLKELRYSLKDIKDSKYDEEVDDKYNYIIISDFMMSVAAFLTDNFGLNKLHNTLFQYMVDFINFIYGFEGEKRLTIEDLSDLWYRVYLPEEKYYRHKMDELDSFFKDINYLTEQLKKYYTSAVYSTEVVHGKYNVSDLACAYAKLNNLVVDGEPNSGVPQIDEAIKRMRVK